MNRRRPGSAGMASRREPTADAVAAVAALLWSVGAGAGLLVLPVAGSWRGDPARMPGDVTYSPVRETLVQVYGPTAALMLAVPIVLCGLAVVADRWRYGRAIRLGIGLGLLLLALAALGLNGLFYLPASLALVYAAARTPLARVEAAA
jgi:hypothetical protein